MIYLPILVLALASIAHDRDWRTPARATLPVVAVVASLAILTVVGNAMISNRLFSVAATTYALDQQLAFQIGQEKDRLIGDPGREVPLVVNGLHGWPSGVFTGVHETFGLSFFDLNADRTRDFLDDHGVLVREPTAAEAARVEDALAGMPVYPEDGWMGLDHGVLVLNFGTGG
jgi:hypothetical protein